MTEPTAGGTILVIDDEAAVLDVIRRSLERSGFRVLSAKDGAAGLALLRAHPEVAAAIVDLTLPDINGLETITRLRDVRGGLPAVLSSGFDAPDFDACNGASRPTAFLPKPFEPEELVAVVRRALGRP